VSDRPVRMHAEMLPWVRGGVYAIIVLAGLLGMRFDPAWGAVVLAAIAGGAALVSPGLGTIVAVLALSLPVLAAAPILGIGMLVVTFAGLRYFDEGDGAVFALVAGSVIGAVFGPVWAAPVLAGALLGPGSGAIAALVGALVVQASGIALGREAVGLVWTGAGGDPLLVFGGGQNMLSTAWLAALPSGFNPEAADATVGALRGISLPGALLVQPLLWAGAAFLTGTLSRLAAKRASMPLDLAAAAVGVVALVAATLATATALGTTLATGALSLGLASSVVVVIGVVALRDTVFPVQVPEARAPRLNTTAEEDADVDELLSLIASAEDQLEQKHTVESVVMITDMKSFSRMTEEDGSMLSAKVIQRHRDLLLPVIARFGGRGKSTGGDGLIAAFDEPVSALKAAVAMQQALAEHNAAHPSERELLVRIGLGSGDVIVDKHGRPFIGNAVNVAARVMNLGDGGDIRATADVAAVAAEAGVGAAPLGDVELKNIAKPVAVYAVTPGDAKRA